MDTGLPSLINWETQPSTSARMKISLASWIVSIETDPRVEGGSLPGTIFGLTPADQGPLIANQGSFLEVFDLQDCFPISPVFRQTQK